MRKLRAIGFLLLSLLLGASGSAHAKYEQEQLTLESQLQQRIEGILAKTLPPSSYLVTVKVEMEDRATPSSYRSSTGGRRGTNPFLAQNKFILPGVPQKKEFVETPEVAPQESVVDSYSVETLVRRISINILVAQDVTAEQIQAIRDFVSASVPFNPLRGDELDIHNSPLLKRVNPAKAPAAGAAAASSAALNANSVDVSSNGFFSSLSSRANLPLVVLLVAVTLLLSVLLLFLFGPVRAFLNRLLAVLPRVGEQAAYAAASAGSKPSGAVGGNAASTVTAAFNAGRNRRNGDDMPFHFIHEEQINKLPILFRQLSPVQAALVLAYLPPEWASRVLNQLQANEQSLIMAELSQAREVPPDVVKEVEYQVKSKLPYLVGGVDWVQSVYQLTQPQTQKALLGALNQQSPELAQQLRKKSFFFEDLVSVGPGPLRIIMQEVGYPAAAQALRDEKPEARDGILRKLPAGAREIIQQELELSVEDRAAMIDAKARIVEIARRLMQEGRLVLPEKK